MTVRSESRDRGAVIPMVALLLPVLILMTAFAVDLGRQRSLRRHLQADADVVALDLVRLIEDPITPPDDPTTLDALNASRARNGMSAVSYLDGTDGAVVQWGNWTPPAPSGSCPLTIVSQPPSCFTELAVGTAAQPINAVRVVFDDALDYFFQPGQGSATRAAVATLGDDPTAEFLMGSTLVSVDPPESWIIGQILQTIIPGADLVGYQGLANAQVTLADLAAALGLGSPQELLDTTVSYEELLIATATALQLSEGDPDEVAAAVGVLNELIALEVGAVTVQLGEVLGLSSASPDSGLDGWVSVPQLLLAGVTVVDGTHLIHVPDTVLNVAGLAGVTLDLNVIEAPIRVGTADGASGTTQQVALGLTIDVDISGDKQQRLCELPPEERTVLGILLGGIFQLLNCLLAPLTTAALDVEIGGQIDLDLTVAGVTGTQGIDCGTGQLDILYDSGPLTGTVDTALGVDVTFDGSPLTLLGIEVPSSGLLIDGTSGEVTFQPTDSGPRHTIFEQLFPDGTTGGPTARIGAPNLGLANLLDVNGVRLTVVNEDLPVLGGIATDLVEPVLHGILNEVDQQIVAALSRLLGLNLGGADLTPQRMQCDDSGVRLVE